MENSIGNVTINVNADGSDAIKTFQQITEEVRKLGKQAKESELVDWLMAAEEAVEYNYKKLQTLQKGTAEYNATLQTLADELEVVDNLTAQLKQVQGEVNDEFERGSTSVESFGSKLGKVAWGAFSAASATAVTSLTALVSKGIQATDFLETSRTAMAGLTGSFEAGNKAMSIAANYWQNNPFQRVDVTNATKQLVQFGRTNNQLGKDLEILGNVSLSTGMNIADLARQYGRVASSGRAMTMDLEMMSDRGVPIYRELSNALGKTQSEVRKMASEGKIDFETFKKAMEGAVSPEAMESYANTLARQTDRLKGSIQILAGQLAGYKIVNDELVISENGLEKAYTRLIEKLATGLRSQGMKDGLEKIGNALAKIVDQITKFVEPAFDKLSKIVDFLGDHMEMLIPIAVGAGSALTGLLGDVPVIGKLLSPVAKGLDGVKGAVLGLVKANPILAGTLGVLIVGFTHLMKTDEDFRKSIGDLLSSLGKIFSTLVPVAQTLLQVFMNVFTNDLIIGGIKLIVGLVSELARFIASIPTDVLAGVVIAILAVKASSVAPWLLWIAAAGTVIQILKDLVPNFMNAAHNMVTGFVNGILQGTRAAVDAVVQLATNIINAFRNALGIHSPSKETYSDGRNLGLGLANGVEDSKSVVQRAMDMLATDILNTIDKVIGNKVDFGVLDITGQYQQWKEVSKMFVEGSTQYQQAMEKMEEARKQANLRIIELQNSYNDTLDDTIDKIASMYSTFQRVDLAGGMDSVQIIENLDQQLAQMKEWDAAQEIIANLNLDEGFKEELKNLGVDSVNELSAIASMTTSELQTMNDLWVEKQRVANRAAIRQTKDLRDDTLEEIRKLKNGIDGETVDVQEVGGRLVSSISEGITGAIPTLQEAYSQLGDYMKKAAKELGAGTDTNIKAPHEGDGLEETITQALQNTVDDITKSFSERLPELLLGAGIGLILMKVVPKVLGKLGITEKLGGVIGNIFKKGTSDAIDQAAKQGTQIAESSTSIGESMNTASKGISNASGVMKTIQEGAKSIILIAVAVIAIAAAIRGAYECLKEVDFGAFQLHLIEMAETITAFGILSQILGNVDIKTIAKGLLSVVEIAVEVVLVAGAIRVAWVALQPIDFGAFQSKLGLMIEVVAAFGALSDVLGLVPFPIILKGFVSVLAVSEEIKNVALAISLANFALAPVDFNQFQPKLLLMIETLSAFEGLSALSGIFAPLIGLGWASILAVCDELVKTSNALRHVYETVPDDLAKLTIKLDYIQMALKWFRDADLGNLIKNITTSWSVDSILKVVGMYTQIAKALGEISGVSINTETAWDNLNTAASVTRYLSGVQIPDQNWAKMEYAVGMSSSIVWKLSELAHAMNEVVDTGTSSQTIRTLLDGLGELLEGIVTNLNGKMGNIEKAGVSVVQALKRGMDSSKHLMGNAGNELQGSLWQALQDKMHDEYEQGRAMANEFGNGLKSVEFSSVGQSMQSSLWQSIQTRMEDEYWQGRALGERFRQGLYDVDYANSGWWAVQGFINGANNRAYHSGGANVWDAGYNVAKTFLDGLRRAGGEGSPWKETFKSGRFAGEGLIEGLEDAEDALVGEATSLADKVVDALTLDNLTLSPSLDAGYSLSNAPQMKMGEGSYYGTQGRGVVINQEINAYTDVDMDAISRDLSWKLSQV